MGPILVVGSLNMDQVVRVPRLPSEGETLLGAGALKLIPGGKGANQAVAMARLGGNVKMAGRVGIDPFGEQLRLALQNDHVDTDLIVIDRQEASGVAFIFLTAEGNNAIVVAGGANMQVGRDQQQLEKIFREIEQARALVLQLEIPLETVEKLIEKAHNVHVPIYLNLAPAQRLPRETLRRVSVLILNESEAALLSGQRVENAEDARIVAHVLQEYGIETIVITLGAAGAVMITRDKAGKTQNLYQEAPKISVVDTTAAGDCFAGALVVALSEGRAAQEALRFAVHASALKVTRFGAQPGLPTRQEVIEAYPQ